MVSNIFYFHPYLGKWSNLTNIFQMGWNHQLEHFGKGHISLQKFIETQPFVSSRGIWIINRSRKETNDCSHVVFFGKYTYHTWILWVYKCPKKIGCWLPVFLGEGVSSQSAHPKSHVFACSLFRRVRKMWSSWQTCNNRRFPMVNQWELESSVVSSQGHEGMIWVF